ncbi:MAG: repair protein SbcC/Rad50 [Sphingomonadales bacterium]|nr:repair protein SbcC/Rad50 [Sphingomonadales bacterium]
MTRLKSLYVKDFRSIDGEATVSLDAPIVLIHGPNGAGKTSLLAAVELALTGAVPSLSRAEPDYLAYLPHKDRPFGEVRLEVVEDDGTIRTADIKVTQSGVTGTPILDGDCGRFFSERSYLAQSTLGRLLEIYQHAEKKSESPLTRFVKELLGLDRMEAIIAGLNSAGHVSRLRGPVPAYWTIREGIPEKQSDADELERLETETAASIAGLEVDLKSRLIVVDASLAERISDLPMLRRELEEDSEEASLIELVRVRREVEVSESSWANANARPGATERRSVEAIDRRAKKAFETWSAEHGDRIEALLTRAAALFADVSLSAESGLDDRRESLVNRTQLDLDRIQRSLAAHESALERRDNLTRQASEARTRLTRLDEQIEVGTAANEDLAKVLAELSSHVHDEICPACDRDFSEVSETPLAAHIAAKVSTMVEHAGRLQALTKDRSSSAAGLNQLERQVAEASSEVLPDPELDQLKRRAADLIEVTNQLNDAAMQMKIGDQLREAAAAAARTIGALQNADQSAVATRSGLKGLADRLGVQAPEEASTGDLLSVLKTAVRSREELLTSRQSARRLAIEGVSAIQTARAKLDSLRADKWSLKARLDVMTEQKAEADRLIEMAKDIVRQTREARGRVVQKVFNDELNAVWRDLFVRLAPEEPFIPAFAIPDATGADIEAVLETHHRRGGKGGNPRAMLSAGNLNTAALTLFLALHLSVPAKLPWLVIDDPVQSMDEVHIAQFAALLRTLSKQMKRQVVIAVHERSLFDYLALELSPAFEGDRLNIIELGRSATGKTTSRWDPKLFVADRAIAA